MKQTLMTSCMLGALTLGAAACKTRPTAQDKAARIVDPDEASHAALQHAVDAALHTNVDLASDALTKSSILIIHRKPIAGPGGHPLDGRRLDAPLQFRLVVNSGRCILIDQRDQSRHELENTRCERE